jgi:AhpC/TSA family
MTADDSLYRWTKLWMVAVGLVCLLAWGAVAWSGGGLDGNSRYAPAFRAFDLRGNTVYVSPGKRGRCILLFFCICPRCQALAHALGMPSTHRVTEEFQVLGILHADLRQGEKFVVDTGFRGRLLVDPLGEVHAMYGVGPCPNVWFVNRGGTIYRPKHDSLASQELGRELERWLAIS